MDKQTEQTLKRTEEIDDKLRIDRPVSKQGMVNIGDTLSRLSAVAFMAAGRLSD